MYTQFEDNLERLTRDIERKCSEPDHELNRLLQISNPIHKQKNKDKNKLYGVHSPEVE